MSPAPRRRSDGGILRADARQPPLPAPSPDGGSASDWETTYRPTPGSARRAGAVTFSERWRRPTAKAIRPSDSRADGAASMHRGGPETDAPRLALSMGCANDYAMNQYSRAAFPDPRRQLPVERRIWSALSVSARPAHAARPVRGRSRGRRYLQRGRRPAPHQVWAHVAAT